VSRSVREVAPELVATTPRELALLILEARLGQRRAAAAGPAVVEPDGFAPTDFQVAGARQLVASLRRWRGALLADDVGLGKTFTALEVVRRRRGSGPVVLVVPVATRAHWLACVRRLARSHPAADCGPGGEPRIVITTHGRLSRGGLLPGSGPPALVVVDEAHAFRNPRTRRYRALAELCRASPVLLVSATPVNNSLSDLYFLIRLHAGDGAFRPLGVPDLRAAFQRAAAAPESLSAAFRAVVDALVVRRTRAAMPGAFPRRRRPERIRYSLIEAFGAGYADLLAMLAGLELPWYGLAAGRRPTATAAGAAPLVRLLLLKRLDSSVAALRLSLRRLAAYNAEALAALRCGTLLLPAAARVRGAADEDQLLLTPLLGVAPPPGVGTAALAAAASRDDVRLRSLVARVDAVAADPKLALLRRRLHALGGVPILVFTGYRDTAEHLARGLAAGFRTALLHGSGGAIGGVPASRAAVIARFAPRSNGVRPPPERERVDVLVATDALSEGINLQDAGVVVSYDLPWNPVRIVQRVGRIDRIGSPHRSIRSCRFMPDAELDALVRITERLVAKRKAARTAWPSVDPAAAAQRAPAGQAARGGTARQRFEAVAAGEAGLRQAYDRLVRQGARPGRREPAFVRLPAAIGAAAGVAVFDVRRRQVIVRIGSRGDGGSARLVPEVVHGTEVTALLERLTGILEPAEPVADCRPSPGMLRVLKAAARAALGVGGVAQSDAAIGAGAATSSFHRRLAERLLGALAGGQGEPDASTAATVDALLARLRTGLNAAEEIALRRALAAAPGAEGAALVRLVGGALGGGRPGTGRREAGAEPGDAHRAGLHAAGAAQPPRRRSARPRATLVALVELGPAPRAGCAPPDGGAS
jgi:superfamily II DNA or RNA helicase